MHKSKSTDETRKELYEKFQATRGASAAFCREQKITGEWLRQVFKGEYEDLDLLIAAADFLKRYKADKEQERERKAQLLSDKVTAISMA